MSLTELAGHYLEERKRLKKNRTASVLMKHCGPTSPHFVAKSPLNRMKDDFLLATLNNLSKFCKS